MRSYRLEVNDGQMVVHGAIFAPHLRHDRQLQHGCSLPRAKVGEQDDLAVWKFDGVVMPARVLRVYLPEPREPSAGIPFPEETKERATPFDITIKREFGTWHKADRYRRRIHGCKAARRGS